MNLSYLGYALLNFHSIQPFLRDFLQNLQNGKAKFIHIANLSYGWANYLYIVQY